ncbi:MAG: hypothetical protein ACREMY_29270, partial [bacterium]
MQLKPLDPESRKAIMTQAAGMGKDWRELRQWWAVPFHMTALKFGEDNLIEITTRDHETYPVRVDVYGDYGHSRLTQSDSYRIEPSPNTMSWQKGFATYEAGDIRLNEPIILNGIARDSYLSILKDKFPSDLSFENGKQTGRYRVRLTVPASGPFGNVGGLSGITPLPPSTKPVAMPLAVWQHEDGLGVAARDQKSQKLAESISLPAGIPLKAQFSLTCEIKSVDDAKTIGVFKIIFSGTDAGGKAVTWQSPWQPDCIEATDEWRSFSFNDTLPDN